MNETRPSRPSMLRIWWSAIRPATLLAGVSPVIVGCALAHAEGHGDPVLGIAALIAALSVQIASNLHNDVADYERGADTEARLGSARASQRGWLVPRQLLGASAIAIVTGGTAGLYIYTVAGTPVVWIAIASIAGAFAYTGGPFPLAYHGLGDLFVVLFFGLVAVGGTYFIHTGGISLPVLGVGVSIGLLTAAILVVNNLRDRETDASANKQTLVVRFGATFGRWQYTLLVALPFALTSLLVLSDRAPTTWLLCWLALPLAIRQIRAVHREDGAALNRQLGRTAQLGMIFSLLLATGVVA